MARTYFDRIAGKFQRVYAIIASAGGADAFKIVATGANGKLDATLMPDSVGADSVIRTATEAIAAGALINIHAGGIRNADATAAGRECDGYCLAAIANGADGAVNFEGIITGLAGLTVGARYYMSEVAGAVTDTPVSVDGNVDQFIGKAISATEISFEPEVPAYL